MIITQKGKLMQTLEDIVLVSIIVILVFMVGNLHRRVAKLEELHR